MKFRKWMPVIVGCITITVLLAWFKVDQIQKAIAQGQSFGEPMEVVELAMPEKIQWQPMVSVTADVVATQTLELTNELGGMVSEVGFSAGDKVLKGQLLVRLSTAEEQAQLAAAQADAQLAKLVLARNQKLAKSGVASQEDKDSALAQYNAAVASEDRLKAIIDKKTLRAPFDASVGIFELEVGSYLQASTAITRLVGSTTQLWLDFNLPQQQATLLVGDVVSVPQPFDEQLEATIIARDSWVNPRSGNLRYRALIDNSAGKIYPGSVVSVSAAVGQTETVTRLPMTAVRYDAFGPNIYVLVPAEAGAAEAERASKRSVTLGPESDQMVVIISGLNSDERVAGNGAFKLRDGILVKAIDVRDSLDVTISTQAKSTMMTQGK
jgi:membrane fusion protein (multidrug efflux system)